MINNKIVNFKSSYKDLHIKSYCYQDDSIIRFLVKISNIASPIQVLNIKLKETPNKNSYLGVGSKYISKMWFDKENFEELIILDDNHLLKNNISCKNNHR